jgi:hypothetical protein
MVVAEKWTGTDSDRQEMEKLQLEQVVRVGASILWKSIARYAILLTRRSAQLW